VNLVEKQYDVSSGDWNRYAIENIGMNALEQGIILKVKDTGGQTVWDATVHNNGLCVRMLEQMAQNMKRQNPNFKGGYEETTFLAVSNQKNIGEADIGYYGPYYYTNNDIEFLNRINTVLVVIGFASLFFAFILGSFMSRRISRPISKAIRAAAEISKGNFKERIKETSDTREISQLTDSVNNMAESLEKQQTLRKTMAADVSHELRTPLATLQSSLEAMIDGIWEPDNKNLVRCHSETIRLGKLIKDLEELAKFEGEIINLTMDNYDISNQVESVLLDFDAAFKFIDENPNDVMKAVIDIE
jgi:signal transduction histidine kinase